VIDLGPGAGDAASGSGDFIRLDWLC